MSINVIQLITVVIQAVTVYMLYRVYRITKRVKRRRRVFHDPVLDSVIGIFGKKQNPNDWKGWSSSGADARFWIHHDGDSVANEAVNIMSWLTANGSDKLYEDNYGVPAVTPQQIADKLKKAGFGETADSFMEIELQKQKNNTDNDTTQI